MVGIDMAVTDHCADMALTHRNMQDAYLPQRLVDKLMYMYNYIEMARVTGVPMSFLLTRGQSIKVFSQILRKARQKNLLVPNQPRVRPRRLFLEV